ncbi:hypothetical protein Tco_0372979 [Tanacetum coccineum]
MPVEKSSASKKPERQIPTGHRFSNKKTTTVPKKTMNPISCLRWKLTGRILKTVGLRWVPTGKLFNSCTSKVQCRNQCQNGFTKDEIFRKTFDRSRSSLGLHGNDVCSHQFMPRSSSNDF